MEMVQINIFVLLCLSASTVNGEEKKCFLSGDENSYCCDNHEEINGTCLECKPGYRSVVGEECKPCSFGTFGRKCGDICKCTVYQKCDYVLGCVNITVTTTGFSDQTSITEKLYINVESTEKSNGEIKPNNILTGLLHREMVIYSICTFFLSIFVLLGLVMLRHYRRQNTNRSQTRTLSWRQTSREDNDSPDMRDEGIYETIDESNLDDTTLQHLPTIPKLNLDNELSSASSDTSCTSTHSLLVDGYINPYQSIVSDLEIHEYSRTHKLSSNSTSSASEDKDGESGYLHPYQTMVSDLDHHDYSLTVYTENDLSSSFECSAASNCNLLSDNIDEQSLSKNNSGAEISENQCTGSTENDRESKSNNKLLKETINEPTVFETIETTFRHGEGNVDSRELMQVVDLTDDI